MQKQTDCPTWHQHHLLGSIDCSMSSGSTLYMMDCTCGTSSTRIPSDLCQSLPPFCLFPSSFLTICSSCLRISSYILRYDSGISRMMRSTCLPILSLPFYNSSILARMRCLQLRTRSSAKDMRADMSMPAVRMAMVRIYEKLQSIWQVDLWFWTSSWRQKPKGRQVERMSNAYNTQRGTISAMRGWYLSISLLLSQYRDYSSSILVYSLSSFFPLRQQVTQATRKSASVAHSILPNAKMKETCKLIPRASPKRTFIYSYWHPG